MAIGKNIFKIGLMSVKVLTGTMASLAIGTAPVVAQTSGSALLGQSQSNQNAVRALVESIKGSAQGPITSSNVGDAIREAISNTPGHSTEQWSAAINQLNLNGNALANAVNAAAESLDVPNDSLVSTMLIDTYSTQGQAQAREQAAQMRDALGYDVVSQALETSSGDFIDSASDGSMDARSNDIYNG